MSNTPPNPTRKTQDDRYSNQSKHGTNPGQRGQESSNPSGQDKNPDRNPTQQKDDNKSFNENDRGGVRNAPQSNDPKREREEEDRPRAERK